MENGKIGSLIYRLRVGQGLGQEELCRGLCSKAALSRFETGERMPDRLLLNALMQRMGKAADQLATVLSADEYAYFVWKKQALNAVGQKDMIGLELLLEKQEALTPKVNEVLQRQFYYRMKAVLAEGDPEKSIELQRKALMLTIPDLRAGHMQQNLISAEEMRIILVLAEQMLKAGQEEEACRLLLEIAEYAQAHYGDRDVRVKIYPKAVKLAAPILIRQKRCPECMFLCRRAVELLCWQGILYDLAELMEAYLQCCGMGFAGERQKYYEKQLGALKEVYREYGVDFCKTENVVSGYGSQEIYLVDEVIKMSRAGSSFSQEVLSEGICTPETLSRVESGRRAPNRGNFYALMEKLDVSLDYYNARLDTDDFLLLEKKRVLDRAMAQAKWSEAQKLLDELKSGLDMTRTLNLQILTADENSIMFWNGRLAPEEFMRACENALGCAQEEWREERFWKQFLTNFKVKILNDLAAAYRKKKRCKEAAFIWEHILEQLEQSHVELADRYLSAMLVIGNLALCYGEMGKLGDCLNMCEKGMRLCFDAGKGVRIAKLLSTKAEVLYLLGDGQNSRKYFVQAYYLSSLMGTDGTTNYIKKFYSENFSGKEEWY